MTDLLLRRLAAFFDKNDTAGAFLSEDGDGGYVAAVARMAGEIERLQGVVQLAAEAIIACEKACWHEGQTIPALNTQIRLIVGEFIKKAKDRGLDFESGAYGSDSAHFQDSSK